MESSEIGSSTYEATMARQSTQHMPDQIHWERDAAFRNQAYRQLHHQRGLMGTFRVHLLEAADLERSYWSPLALGPVKHLGLSKAHGEVSSFCSFALDYESVHPVPNSPGSSSSSTRLLMQASPLTLPPGMNVKMPDQNDGKMPAKVPRTMQQLTAVSPIVHENNNPVWSDCHFEMALRKGSMTEDGMRIMLRVRVDEDVTAAERLIPGMPSGEDDRLLGIGSLDITPLCLGETPSGVAQVGVLDSWIPIYPAGDDQSDDFQGLSPAEEAAGGVAKAASLVDDGDLKKPAKSFDNESSRQGGRKTTGRVRVLVSYKPNGLTPEEHDIVALEAYARRSLKSSSCQPVLPPLLPLTVRERRDAYLLVEYNLSGSANGHSESTSVFGNGSKKGCMRLHRNAVFVIERKNIVDATVDFALLPADAIMSTPLGKKGAEVIGPAIMAGKELLMPAMLSIKLLWMAMKTTTVVGFTGVQAAGNAIWQEGSGAWIDQNEESRYRKERARATERLAQL